MTTEEDSRERFEEVSEKLTELKAESARTSQRLKELDNRSREQLAEAREDTKRTRRLWDRLAAKHGWPDYDDLDRSSW